MLTDTPPAPAPAPPVAVGLAGELDCVAAYLERHGDLPTTAVTVRRIARQVGELEAAVAAPAAPAFELCANCGTPTATPLGYGECFCSVKCLEVAYPDTEDADHAEG